MTARGKAMHCCPKPIQPILDEREYLPLLLCVLPVTHQTRTSCHLMEETPLLFIGQQHHWSHWCCWILLSCTIYCRLVLAVEWSTYHHVLRYVCRCTYCLKSDLIECNRYDRNACIQFRNIGVILAVTCISVNDISESSLLSLVILKWCVCHHHNFLESQFLHYFLVSN